MTVHKLIVRGTVDEGIYEIGKQKRELSDAVLANKRKSNGDSHDDDVNAIAWILQKALQDVNRTPHKDSSNISMLSP